jgi:exosortase
MASSADPNPKRSFPTLLVVGLLVGTLATVWAFWTTLGDAAEKWAHNPQYSHGYIVPIFAVLLLWLRRKQFNQSKAAPSWWGLGILLAGIALHLYGTRFSYEWFEAVAFLPCLAGVWVCVGGWGVGRWAWPSILFLFFMIPLASRVDVLAADPLQRLATVASCYALQTLGLPAVPEGNVILLNDVRLGIVEACSGLRMLVVFFALSTGVALLMKRPLWERLVVLGSAIPIALFSNIVRITATGVLHVTVSSEFANTFFHDVGGWLMMPLALVLLGVELKILGKMLRDTSVAGPITMGVLRPVATSAPSRRVWQKETPKQPQEEAAPPAPELTSVGSV